ncbi:hypothetical protein [Bowmanella dokdonensis]|uniref:Uncharacterized protein n=1 Tax=Bowmanella dokdonensis TaxID=751969 RepID=A0A939DRY6_9ALTE|nr:hypothetical protein [Bowmanella dokdonensis]MBN7827664.1 hypothetical protein [Bowmanella dokdonensis]
MNSFAFTNYLSKFKLILTLFLLTILTFGTSFAGGEAKMLEQTNVTVLMAGEIFNIPKSHLSPNREFPDKIRRENMIEVTFFFPDFKGFGEEDDIATVGRYNPNQVTAFWTKINGGGRLDASKSLSNAIKYGLSERDSSLDLEGLTAYRNVHDSGVTYLAQNYHGDNVLIHCSDGQVNSVCKLEYLDSTNDRGIFTSFDKKFLLRWSEINNKLLSLIEQWKV